jgi:hypothetical protein
MNTDFILTLDALLRAAMYTDSRQSQQQQQQPAIGGERSLYEEPIFLMDPVQFSNVRKQKGLGRGEADRYSGVTIMFNCLQFYQHD